MSELTRRYRLYLGFRCNARCNHCYYRGRLEEPFYPLEKVIGAARHYYLNYGCRELDITGGEPSIYPQIAEVARQVKEIGYTSTLIITNGLKLDLCNRLDLDELLISIHGFGETHDRIVGVPGAFIKIRNGIAGLKKPFRANTTITRENYQELPLISRFLTFIHPMSCNFLVINPWENADSSLQARYSDIAPLLELAIDILDEKNIPARVRYFPFCQLKGYEQYIVNFSQACFDRYEQGYGVPRTIPHFLRAAREAAADRFTYTPACKECALMLVCDGFSRGYVERYGTKEALPYQGAIISDPLHFLKDI